jgi:ribonuclease P protein component
MKSLKNKSKIEELFSSSAKKVNTPSVRARFIKGDGEVLISVPSKIFKRAVDRNRLKRLMRESLKDKYLDGVDLALVYNKSIIEDFDTIKKDIDKIFEII